MRESEIYNTISMKSLVVWSESAAGSRAGQEAPRQGRRLGRVRGDLLRRSRSRQPGNRPIGR